MPSGLRTSLRRNAGGARGQQCRLVRLVKSARLSELRVVAQLGRALGSGPRGRWFESSQPDHESAGRRPYGFRPFLFATALSDASLRTVRLSWDGLKMRLNFSSISQVMGEMKAHIWALLRAQRSARIGPGHTCADISIRFGMMRRLCSSRAETPAPTWSSSALVTTTT